MKYILLLMALWVSGCTRSDDDCSQVTACTEVFVSICIKIEKENQPQFKVNSLEVVFEDTGEKKIIVDSFNTTYCFINDRDLSKLQKSGTKVTLVGKDSKGTILFNEKYIIGHDCCHVLKLDGKDLIIIK